ncbi:MAG: ComEA family DNA-binding protein [Acholeplasmataceae bacterium]
MKRKLGIVWVAVLIGIFVTFPKPHKEPIEYKDLVKLEIIAIHIEGEVVFPGTYYAYQKTDLSTVIKQAGGLMPNAISPVNRELTKDEVIIIPAKQAEESKSSLLDLNKASFQELILIPSITEARAAAIIIYREQHGNFLSLEDLLLVKGIGVSTLEKIRPYLKIN